MKVSNVGPQMDFLKIAKSRQAQAPRGASKQIIKNGMAVSKSVVENFKGNKVDVKG